MDHVAVILFFVHNTQDARERIRQRMATKGNTTARQGEENDAYVRKRLVSQENKLKAKHIEALVMCHAGRDEMISLQ